MTQIYTILFDLDGTIINTAPDLMSAHNHVMKKFGHPTKELGEIKNLAGKGAWMMMQRSFKKDVTDEKLKKEMTNEFIDFYSGTEPWIKFTKIRDKDNDGVIEMFNNVNPYNDLDNYLEWKIIGGKLIKQ